MLLNTHGLCKGVSKIAQRSQIQPINRLDQTLSLDICVTHGTLSEYDVTPIPFP